MIRVEFCIDSVEGLREADRLGADTIELCAALGTGGLTPSNAVLDRARGCETPVHVLIRPRPGGFVYSATEIDLMADDIAAVRRAGLAGVVIGAATGAGTLDPGALREMIAAAGPLATTLHRVVDTLADPLAGVEVAVALGMDRVLASGGAARAPDGAGCLAEMVALAGQRIEIVAGAGLGPENVADLVVRTGVRSVHASCSAPRPDVGGRGLFSDGPLRGFDPARGRAFLDTARGVGAG